MVRAERVDAVLIAGDVYDRAMPAPETVALLSEALVRLVDAGAQVIVSSGNHDSAVRLGFASGLLERSGVHLRTGLGDVARPVIVRDTAVYPIPYLEPRLVAPVLQCAPTHADVLTEVLGLVPPGGLVSGASTSVVMAHTFVTGCASTDSERDILSGGLGAVHPDVFAGFSYVALGHLHGRQQVADTVRYSGSPVAMSFSEVAHTKGSLLVELERTGARVETVAAPVHRRIATLRGELADLLTDRAHGHAEDAWCQITLTDPHRPVGAMDRLRARFPHTLELRFEPSGGIPLRSTYAARVADRTPLDVCCDFLSHVRAGAPTGKQDAALFEEALGRSREGRAATQDEGQVGAA